MAIDDARNRANFAASSLGLKVVGVKSISLNELPPIPPPPQPEPFALQKAPAGGTPIISGQQQVSESVSIIFLVG